MPNAYDFVPVCKLRRINISVLIKAASMNK